MTETDELAVLVSNTGPLISAFQSDSFDLVVGLLGIDQVYLAAKERSR